MSDRFRTTTLAAIGGLITGLVITLAVIMLTSDGGDDTAATTAPTTTSSTTLPTTTAPTTTTTAASTTTAATTSSTSTTTTIPFPGDLSTKGTDSITGTPGALTDIRLGDHDGYTRIVFDFEGAGEHWWTVGYVPDVVGGGSGESCGVTGVAILGVEVRHASAFWVEQTYFGPTEFGPSFASSVVQIKYCDDFEAVLQMAIGVEGERPFRAFTMQDPLRLVIDVAD